MNDKLDEILNLLKSQNEMIKDIHDYVKEVTSEKYIGESRMTSFSINLAADILTEAISPKIKGMMVDLLRIPLRLVTGCWQTSIWWTNSSMPRNYSRTRAWGCAANAGGWLPAQTDVMSWCPVNGTGSSRRRKPPKSS